MACNPDFVQYVVDQCADAGEITARKMFGDYGIYCHGKIFGLICDDHQYLASLVAATCSELPAPKPKKRKSSLR